MPFVLFPGDFTSGRGGCLRPSLYHPYSLLGWISLKPLQGVGKKEEARKAEKEVRRQWERGGAALEGSGGFAAAQGPFLCAQLGERACPRCDFELPRWGSFPPAQSHPPPDPPPRVKEFSLQQTKPGRRFLLPIGLFCVMQHVLPSLPFLWQPQKYYPKCSPDIHCFICDCCASAAFRAGSRPGCSEATWLRGYPSSPPLWFFPITGGLGEGSCQGNGHL